MKSVSRFDIRYNTCSAGILFPGVDEVLNLSSYVNDPTLIERYDMWEGE